MQSVHRQFGKLRYKSPGNNAQLAALLNDYEDVDRVLAKIIDQTKSWRDSWVNIAHSQLSFVTEYEGLIDPIQGTTDGHGKPAVVTPEFQLDRTLKLKEAFTELKTDLMEEVALIDARVITPVTDARECISPFKKTIKKRENKRLDYEQAQEKHSKLQRKMGRNPKEDKALEKAEADFERAKAAFNAIDSYIREALPPIVGSAFNIVPPIVAGMVLIQNRLLGLYYTTLHNYCQDCNFPSPPPPMDDVMATWSADYTPARKDVEAIPCIAGGKAVRQPMRLADDSSNHPPSMSANSSSAIEDGSLGSSPGPMPPRPSRIPSIPANSPKPPLQSKPTFNSDHLTPTDFTTASRLGGQTTTLSPSANPRSDYFGHPTRRTSASTTASSLSLSHTYASTARTPSPGRTTTPAVTPGNAAANIANITASIAKKKPPPPPPPKRINTNRQPEEFVVALYDFAGQGAGDLSFREGDRIKIVKKTQTDQDWWVGEIGGAKGSFPANYCKTT